MKRILYVYHATPGLNGAYIAGLDKGFDSADLDVVYAVNAKYAYGPPSNGVIWRLFFPFSETERYRSLDRFKIIKITRLFIRYLELLYAAVFLAIYCLFRRVDVVNYSLTESYRVNYWIFRAVSAFVPKTVVTVHDVIPHNGIQDQIRSKIFNLADVLLVHNHEARRLLAAEFPDLEKKIVMHVFPWALQPPPGVGSLSRKKPNNTPLTICFAGFIRWSKGLDLLVAVWLESYAKRLDLKLVIAGSAEFDVSGLVSRTQGSNIEWRLGRMNDSAYLQLLADSDAVCLPYREIYAHSSVHLVAYLWAKRPVIATDVGPFRADVGNTGVICPVGQLRSGLDKVVLLGRDALHQMGEAGCNRIAKRQDVLGLEMLKIYCLTNFVI